MELKFNVILKDILRAVEAERYREALDQFIVIFQHPTAKIPPQVAGDVSQLLLLVLSKMTILERAVFAKAVSRSQNLPEPIVRKLLKETPAVSSHLILLAPFTDEELIDIIDKGDLSSRVTITRRPNLTVPVTDQLVDVGELPVLVGLARNTTAKLSRKSFDAMADVAPSDADLNKALASRDDLPLDIATKLSQRTGMATTARLAQMLKDDLKPKRGPLVLRGPNAN
jgi:uncharacterized protein (DUF2336 family)